MSYKPWENGGVPPRWLNCPRKGQPIYHFLPFKTPLSSRYDSFVPPSNRFGVQMVFQSAAPLNRRIIMWVDLTKTDRFYAPEDVTKAGAQYVKLKLSGHDEAPTDAQCKRFFEIVAGAMLKINHMTAQQPAQYPLIGIHCTHGFNRTGFLICAYLITHLEWDVSAAIQTFAMARPPGIYKRDYIEELYRRYEQGVVPSDLQRVELPKWCFDEQDSNDPHVAGTSGSLQSSAVSNGLSPGKRVLPDALSSDDDDDDLDTKRPHFGDDESDTVRSGSDAVGTSFKKPTFVKPDAKFLDGQVRSVTLVSDYEEIARIQIRVQQICGREAGTTGGTSGFPGGQPVSLAFENMHLLAQNRYKVSWKADGLRYLMYVEGRDRVYMIDRDNTVFLVPKLRFPTRKDPSKDLENTLLDGEMVIDKVNGQEIPRYLIYDIVLIAGQEVGKLTFDRRTACIQNEIIEPRNVAIRNGVLDKTSEPFSVRIKQFYDLSQARMLLEDAFARQLAHKMDGLVLQPVSEPYVSGTWHTLLKWKPPTENSIDFRLRIFTKRDPGCLPEERGLLYVNGYTRPVGEIRITRELQSCDDKIIECFFDHAKNEWQFMRIRTDKSHPNAYSVMQNIMCGIQRPITQQVLIDFINNTLSSTSAASSTPEATAGSGHARKQK